MEKVLNSDALSTVSTSRHKIAFFVGKTSIGFEPARGNDIRTILPRESASGTDVILAGICQRAYHTDKQPTCIIWAFFPSRNDIYLAEKTSGCPLSELQFSGNGNHERK